MKTRQSCTAFQGSILQNCWIVLRDVVKEPGKRVQHRTTTGRPQYVFVVDNCWHETNKSYEVREQSSENCISTLHLSLNISIKLNEMLIDAFVVFFHPHGPFEAPFYKITFGRRPLREGSEFAASEDRLNKHKVCNVRVEPLFNPSFLLFSTSLFPSPPWFAWGWRQTITEKVFLFLLFV